MVYERLWYIIYRSFLQPFQQFFLNRILQLSRHQCLLLQTDMSTSSTAQIHTLAGFCPIIFVNRPSNRAPESLTKPGKLSVYLKELQEML